MRTTRQSGMITLMALLIGLLVLGTVPVPGVRGQGTAVPEVYAEAIGQANLRSGPGIEYPVVGEIAAGTRYRVLVRHILVPWLQIEYLPAPSGQAWVYVDLVTVTGGIGLVPAVDDFPAPDSATPTPPPSFTPTEASAPVDDAPSAITNTPPPPTTINGPTVTTQGDANIRFGPDISYASIVKVPAGSTFRILEFHSQFAWVHIAVPESPTGSGWVYRDIVEINGDTSLVPTTSATTFNLPTLTPTPQTVSVNYAPWNGALAPSGELANTLGAQMDQYLLDQGFAPYSDQFASVFVLDLRTGDSFTLNGNIAYSGMSLTKIPILVTFFQRINRPLTADEAYLVADTMMCSENLTTNQLLEIIGESEPLTGAQRVTATMQRLGLDGTFIMRQYVTVPGEEPVGVGTLTTNADQDIARPDLYNQMVPQDIGWLLAGIYQCAQDGSGLLTERFPDDITQLECRQMLYAMDGNVINVFLEAGVPPGTRVIHKHGWVDDTHGDAGIVIGPQGAYVFVATIYEDTSWLAFDQTAVVMGELSRLAWNHFNPTNPLSASRPGVVPEACDARSSDAISALLSSSLPMPGP
ncbi:MAG: SH3 domain-containing protein [Chloroflexi bacterium]|nr:SH3 domain-containing protein [Chloroflexota bacterium]